ncbi:hypothetical protein [Phreatobacter stygius]|uniref:Sulfur globule protein n=1 Tax=Phreatobacter stygius TaxID=1940610 RepID=A0A4D7B205_9HYPH|nr:hypothetical protein [Phreatobacter stygius]QCI67614.1 hypothetical protein E8M01_27340 [Phreatobacter stygius]
MSRSIIKKLILALAFSLAAVVALAWPSAGNAQRVILGFEAGPGPYYDDGDDNAWGPPPVYRPYRPYRFVDESFPSRPYTAYPATTCWAERLWIETPWGPQLRHVRICR